MKPEMGVFAISSKTGGDCYLYAAADLKALMNRYRFQLHAGSHPNRELQAQWNMQGGSDFSIEILERLDYGKDESKTDYAEELELLYSIWEERLATSRK